MPKPIVFITLPFCTAQQVTETRIFVSEKLGDEYHVLVCCDRSIEVPIKMEVFYEKDYKEIDIEALVKMIEDVRREEVTSQEG